MQQRYKDVSSQTWTNLFYKEFINFTYTRTYDHKLIIYDLQLQM